MKLYLNYQNLQAFVRLSPLNSSSMRKLKLQSFKNLSGGGGGGVTQYFF